MRIFEGGEATRREIITTSVVAVTRTKGTDHDKDDDVLGKDATKKKSSAASSPSSSPSSSPPSDSRYRHHHLYRRHDDDSFSGSSDNLYQVLALCRRYHRRWPV